MYPIKAYCLGEAHAQVVKRIFDHGKYVVTQDHEITLELIDTVIDVATPMAQPMVHPGSNFQGKKLEEYVDGLLNGKKGTFTYDYHTRLFEWSIWEDGYDPINQIKNIINYLNQEKNRDGRRAVAITWYPWKDLEYSGPCLQNIQFLIRGGFLHMSVLFRSNDMLSAAGANMYALVALQQQVAANTRCLIGSYCHHSVSAHIYVIRDQKELEDMVMASMKLTRDHARGYIRAVRPDIPWKE